ncbi:MAG: hypothetical protein JXC85_00740 [Candidatus Aenigmarchaeota archaeon]|nr:hypothetical protein [Candidatus Aenigmarchaeota archaeon]
MAAERFGGEIVCTSNRVPIDRELFRDYVYFSVVSGSTLGYGELTPLGLTRLFVGIEVIMFWLFIVYKAIYYCNYLIEIHRWDTVGIVHYTFFRHLTKSSHNFSAD